MINLNGKILPANEPVFTANNRAFLYGDGIFETIRVFDGRIPFWGYHFERLSKGMGVLHFEKDQVCNSDYLLKEIYQILPPKANARVRLTAYRSGEEKYRPLSNEPSFLIQSSPLEENHFVLNQRGLKVGFYDECLLPCGQAFHNLKTTNCLPYILASHSAERQNGDDCLMLNSEGRVAEATSSNIFVKKGEEWFTPELSEGCVAGVMREVILKGNFLKTQEIKMEVDFLLEGEEIFLTNAVKGIQWVEWVGGKNFPKRPQWPLWKILPQ